MQRSQRCNLDIQRLHIYPGASAYRLVSAEETEPLPGEANADFYSVHSTQIRDIKNLVDSRDPQFNIPTYTCKIDQRHTNTICLDKRTERVPRIASLPATPKTSDKHQIAPT